MEKQYIDVSQVAKLLSVSEGHVYKLLKLGLPHYKIGKRYRFEESRIHSWLNKNEVWRESCEEE